MKRMFLLCAMLLCGFIALSQETCDDIIITEAGNQVIFGCCIKKVIDGNIVIYDKDGKRHSVVADAVQMDGKYLELEPLKELHKKNRTLEKDAEAFYHGDDYLYFKRLYDGSRTRRSFGIYLTAIGVAFELSSLILANKPKALDALNVTPGNLAFAGTICAGVGVPLWISGGIRAGNNKRAMEEIERTKNLSLSFSPQGLTFIYRF